MRAYIYIYKGIYLRCRVTWYYIYERAGARALSWARSLCRLTAEYYYRGGNARSSRRTITGRRPRSGQIRLKDRGRDGTRQWTLTRAPLPPQPHDQNEPQTSRRQYNGIIIKSLYCYRVGNGERVARATVLKCVIIRTHTRTRAHALVHTHEYTSNDTHARAYVAS